jgi:high affinity Mn2+ porin
MNEMLAPRRASRRCLYTPLFEIPDPLRIRSWHRAVLLFAGLLLAGRALGQDANVSTASSASPDKTTAISAPAPSLLGPGKEAAPAEPPEQWWNFHLQNTEIVNVVGGFHAPYAGAHSLLPDDIKNTETLDLFFGVRLWSGAELHVDGLIWNGFGLSNSLGIEDFPNGDAYKAGAKSPNGTFAHLFIRQTIGLGGEQEKVADDQLTLAGKQDISRLTFTLGRMSAQDMFDHNTYANDPHRQFMNWSMVANVAWDYGQDTIGYGTGLVVELNQPDWAVRYAFFQMPAYRNKGNVGSGDAGEDEFLTWPTRGHYAPFFKSWDMSAEFERRWSINSHPGVVRILAFLNDANMDSFQAATSILRAQGPNADISSAQAYQHAYGFGLNWEQEVAKNVGLFSRLGWNDGKTMALQYTDVNWTASLGVSVKGESWRRPGDTFGLAGVISGASRDAQKFLAAGGLGTLDGDGALSYRPEKVIETYYDCAVWKVFHLAFDYQFVADPAFNRARGPVSVFGARLHWEF